MTGPLNGVKVVDLSRFISGPYCGLLLADMGAEVIKVEKKGGEDTRNVPPFVEKDSLYTASLNRNKRAISLDYRHEEAGTALKKLFQWADIIIENFRPGTLEKMGFGPEAIFKMNPKAIIVRCSGFGQTGPLKNRPGFDAIAQAMSGLMSMTGRETDPPMLAGTYVMDYATGLHAAVGALSSLYEARLTGQGQVVDVSLYESAVSMLVAAIPTYHLFQELPKRVGSGDRYASPVNAFETKSGWVYISAPNNNLWKRLCNLMERTDLLDDPGLQMESQRLERTDELNGLVQQWAAQYERAELIKVLEEAGIPCAPVQNINDLLTDEHLRERNQIVEVNHPVAGKIPMSGITVKLSRTPGKIKYGAPLVGQHNEEVYLNELGFTKEQFDALREKGLF